MKKKELEMFKKLCQGIVLEAVHQGYGDFWDNNYNPDFQIKVDIKISEIRIAAAIINFHPTGAMLKSATKARDWREYIEELDGVG